MIKQQDIFNFEFDTDDNQNNISANDYAIDSDDSNMLNSELLHMLSTYNYFVTQTPCVSEIEITPIMANFLLKYRNPNNRPLDRNRLRQYVTDAKSGNWKNTGDTIKILIDGTIADGQHRLAMVTIINKPIKFLVVTGLNEDSIEAIDTGKPRTGKDVLTMFHNLSDKDAGMISTAIKKIMAYERRASLAGGAESKSLSTNPAIREYFDKHQTELLNSLHFVKKVSDKNTLILQRGDFIFLHYIFSQIDKNDADTFMLKFITGADLPISSNIFMLRNIIIKSKKSTSLVVKLHHILYTVIKAWNKDRKTPLKPYTNESTLKYYQGDTYPIAF